MATLGIWEPPDNPEEAAWYAGMEALDIALDFAIAALMCTINPAAAVAGGAFAVAAELFVVVLASAGLSSAKSIGMHFVLSVVSGGAGGATGGGSSDGTSGSGGTSSSMNTGGWGKGSYGSAADSLSAHFAKHGGEVGAKTAEDYLRKAEAAMRQRKGRGKIVDGATPNVRRFDVHGTDRYVDVDVTNEQVISYGKK